MATFLSISFLESYTDSDVCFSEPIHTLGVVLNS